MPSLEEKFEKVFNCAPVAATSACGRVNLIGEHIDYNGGIVLPATIDKLVRVAVRQGDARQDEIHSQGFGEIAVRPVGDSARKHWSDYVAGALSMAREVGILEGGVRVAIESNIPHGAGVSSSAAVIIATLRAVQAMSPTSPDKVQLAKWAQLVEHNYIGMPCGIMDQMAIAVAEPGGALALDTDTLDYFTVVLPKDHHFAVLFSGVKRQLDEGRYAIRRQECEAAAEALQVDYICKMSAQESEAISALAEPLQKRARHVYSEHHRVVRAIQALKEADISQVGRLMNESHDSMRDDFEISTSEVDAVVDSAREFGAVGARMTGGGFGGCIVACVTKMDVESWKDRMEAKHTNAKFIC